MSSLTALQDTKNFWYLSRGSGAVATLLFTLSVVLGILASVGYSARLIPRFLLQGVHRNVSLLVVVFTLLHAVMIVLDGFVDIGWIDVFVPFRAGYQPWWVGLGTLAFDALIAVTVSSLARTWLSYRVWRGVHWAAYGAWPIAVLHGLKIGSDRNAAWLIWLHVGCIAAVAGFGFVRVWAAATHADPRLPAYRPQRQ